MGQPGWVSGLKANVREGASGEGAHVEIRRKTPATLSRAARGDPGSRRPTRPRRRPPRTSRPPDPGEGDHSCHRGPARAPRPLPRSPAVAPHPHGTPAPWARTLGAACLPVPVPDHGLEPAARHGRLPTPSPRSSRTHAPSRGPHPPLTANAERRPAPRAEPRPLTSLARPMASPAPPLPANSLRPPARSSHLERRLGQDHVGRIRPSRSLARRPLPPTASERQSLGDTRKTVQRCLITIKRPAESQGSKTTPLQHTQYRERLL